MQPSSGARWPPTSPRRCQLARAPASPVRPRPLIAPHAGYRVLRSDRRHRLSHPRPGPADRCPGGARRPCPLRPRARSCAVRAPTRSPPRSARWRSTTTPRDRALTVAGTVVDDAAHAARAQPRGAPPVPHRGAGAGAGAPAARRPGRIDRARRRARRAVGRRRDPHRRQHRPQPLPRRRHRQGDRPGDGGRDRRPAASDWNRSELAAPTPCSACSRPPAATASGSACSTCARRPTPPATLTGSSATAPSPCPEPIRGFRVTGGFAAPLRCRKPSDARGKVDIT